MKLLTALLVVYGSLSASAYHDPHWFRGRNVIVHLFEWKWSDIANECENFLAPHGYAGVQISPPNENFLETINNRPWSERYQPMSYKLITRSGTEASFADMTRRCNAVGVRIYPDIVVNHMSGMTGVGTGGSYGNAETGDFPGVPYVPADFNSPRCTMDWNNPPTLRDCEIYGLRDLNQTRESVRGPIVDYLNHLIDLGVAGFRVDIMKHMWPQDIEVIWGRLKNLNVNFGFAANSRPFIVGEVYDDQVISGTDFHHLGTTTEFKFVNAIAKSFRGQDALKWMQNFGEGWGFHPSQYVLSFVTNHDTQREGMFSYKEGRLYRMAVAFHLGELTLKSIKLMVNQACYRQLDHTASHASCRRFTLTLAHKDRRMMATTTSSRRLLVPTANASMESGCASIDGIKLTTWLRSKTLSTLLPSPTGGTMATTKSPFRGEIAASSHLTVNIKLT